MNYNIKGHNPQFENHCLRWPDNFVSFLRTNLCVSLCMLYVRVCVHMYACHMVRVWRSGTILGTDSPFCLVWESLLLIAECARQLTTLFVTRSSVKGRGSQAGGGEGWPEVESVASQGLECGIHGISGPGVSHYHISWLEPVSNLKNLEFCQPPRRMLTQPLACYSKDYPRGGSHLLKRLLL